MAQTVYMAVTKDRFYLPIAIADTPEELAKCTAVEEDSGDDIRHKRYKAGTTKWQRDNAKYKFVKVSIPNE